MSNYEKLKETYITYGATVFIMALHNLKKYGSMVKELPASVFGEFITDETKQQVKTVAMMMADMEIRTILALIQRELPDIEGDGIKVPLLNGGHKDGICPCCGAKVEYLDDQEIYDDSNTCVSWKCPGCGATGTAEYHGVFAGHTDVKGGI